MDKVALRTLMKKNLRQEAENLICLHSSVSKNLVHLISKLNSEKFINGLKLGVYSPIGNEPKWWECFPENLVNEFLVVHMYEDIKLSYHRVDFEILKANQVGLVLDKNVICETSDPDIILIPGLAYTKEFERLGRGRAYFDSFLKDFKGIKIGIFFSMQEVESVFCEEHDEILDYIVTEKDILIRGNR